METASFFYALDLPRLYYLIPYPSSKDKISREDSSIFHSPQYQGFLPY